MIRPKSKGSGIMVSNFVDECNGYLTLTGEEFEEGRKSNPKLEQQALTTIEYGETAKATGPQKSSASKCRRQSILQKSDTQKLTNGSTSGFLTAVAASIDNLRNGLATPTQMF